MGGAWEGQGLERWGRAGQGLEGKVRSARGGYESKGRTGERGDAALALGQS